MRAKCWHDSCSLSLSLSHLFHLRNIIRCVATSCDFKTVPRRHRRGAVFCFPSPFSSSHRARVRAWRNVCPAPHGHQALPCGILTNHSSRVARALARRGVCLAAPGVIARNPIDDMFYVRGRPADGHGFAAEALGGRFCGAGRGIALYKKKEHQQYGRDASPLWRGAA